MAISVHPELFFPPIILLFKHFTSSPERGGSQPPTGFARAQPEPEGFYLQGFQ